MTQTVLLAVDAARKDAAHHVTAAARQTAELCRDTGDRVVVLHVHEFAYGRFGRLQIDCAEGDGEKVVDQVLSELRAAGVTADGEIAATDYGHIARSIVDAADQHQARMIVLGSSSRTDLPRLPFGSVSHRLLHIATRPVLIVPWTTVSAAQHEPQPVAEVQAATS